MIDDLCDDRLAAIDFALLFGGTVLLVASEQLGIESLTAADGTLVTLGVVVFTANMLLVIHRHSPHPLYQVVFGSLTPRRTQNDRTPTDQQS